MKTKYLFLSLLLFTVALSALTLPDTSDQNLIPVSVSVTGDVKNPGIYTLTNLNHVSEALDMANGEYSPLPVQANQLNGAANASMPSIVSAAAVDTAKTQVFRMRAVTFISQGTQQQLDLLKYYRLGDVSQNPYLRDGDVIIVHPVRAVVTLQGSVQKPGDYEFRQGDTLKGMLELALGFKDDAELSQVMLYRYKGDYSSFDKTELDLSGYPDAADDILMQPLQAGDRILVPSNSEYRKAYQVQVTGKVKMPGMYYVDAKTTLYDLMQMCGGPTAEADLGSSFIFNRIINDSYDPDFERLKRFAYNQMTWLEYSYFKTKARQLKGKYSIDVQKCWDTQGAESNMLLREGDELYVPEILNGVWVAGQVKNPGLITWNESMNWKDYVQAAGGFANNRKSQGIRIIRVHSGNWVKPSDKIMINPGDIVFIPEKEEKYTWDYVREAILITSQLLTILIALRTF
jgi:protein involved in polysaccharide export with SLBB domain